MTTRSFVWLSIGGGAWSLASNWNDVSDGISPSLIAPGAQDSVTVTGPSGAQVQTIGGGGAAAMALFAGNTLLSGGYAFGTLAVGGTGTGAILQLGAGTSLSTGTASIASGSLLAGHGSTLTVAGTLALGTTGVAGATLNATGGAAASILALLLSDSADSIYVDPTSILEVGASGGDAAGYLTIDAGYALSGQGSANAYGSVANNGTLSAAGGTLTVGALSGTGSLQIGAGATLTLNGACGAGQAIGFTGANATLALKQEAFAPAGTLTGFAAGDAIDVLGSAISSASYAAGGASGGILTLFYGGQVAAQIHLAGSYGGSVFLTAGDGAGGTLVTVAPATGGGGTRSPGTSTPDQYVWTAPGSGAWNVLANWQDVTTGATPAAIAPGLHNLVGITASQDAFSVITGPANAASLTLLGEVGLAGAYTIGTLAVGQASGTAFTPGTLDALAGTAIATQAAIVADGGISVAGSASSLSVAGTLVLGGSTELGVGLPTAALTASAGASVQAAGLVMGGGSGATLTTDPTGSVEIGTAGGAVAGAVTVDAGATLSGNGQVNPLGVIVDNGTILASGGTLTAGAVSGTGSLAVAAGATLELLSPTSLQIVLDGSAASGGSVLALSSARAVPTGTLTGFVIGDAIDLEGSPLTGVQYSSSGTLLLIYNTAVVARVPIAGVFSGQHFQFDPDGAGGTLITLVANSGGVGGPGQTGTDQLAWTSPVSGSWSRAVSWWDMTSNLAATLPPGGQTPVQIAGPGGFVFQSVTGTGTCASLSLTGNTLLSGSYTAGQITVGQLASVSASAVDGVLQLSSNSALSAARATLASGDLIVNGVGSVLTVTGTLAVGSAPAGVGEPDTMLSVLGHGTAQLGGLTLGGGDSDSVTVDSSAVLEIGQAGGAAQGALTVDAGALVSGNGSVDASGPIVDNGDIEAQGGTLTLGAVSGTGSLGIGTEAALALGGGEPCPISFEGGGGALLLPGSAQPIAAVISGFSPGDSIVTGSPIDGVAFAPGAGGVGTLTLSEAGQPAGQLLLAGNFAGETFSVLADGAGAAILLSQGPSGPPPGTVTPDLYRWAGPSGTQAWGTAANWTDVSQGTGTALAAPGQNDLVTIAGGTATALTVTGPADAASLSLAGTVSLSGLYAIGTLSVGSAQAAGLLALGVGATLSAAAAQVAGGIAVGGGALSLAGTLALASNGVLAVSGGSAVRLGAAILGGAGSELATDLTGSIEIGGYTGAAAGTVVVDAGGVLQGAGLVAPSGQLVDQGTVAAVGGTLVLGGVSGTGTLLVGAASDLVLTGAAAPGLTADFTGGGTLTLAAAQGNPAIADFGTGDTILLPVSGATEADYAATGPGTGLLTLSGGGQTLAQLTLLGSQAGRVFSVAGMPGGGTILTTQPDNTSGDQGETIMPNANFATGQIARSDLLNDIAVAFPYVSQQDVGDLIGNEGIYLDYSTDGLDPAQTVFGGADEGPGVNVEVVAPLNGVTAGSVGPGGLVTLTGGYSALLLQGNENETVTDGRHGNALIVGNYGSDLLFAGGDGDTLVGATGANTTFSADLQNGNHGSSLPIDVYVHGGGNDTIATNNDNAAITTSGGRSTVFLGGSQNSVQSNGSDTIICGQYGDDTITAQTPGGRAGDVVFSPDQGILNFIGSEAPSTIVGGGGDVYDQGNAGGGLIWAASSNVYYTGGTGAGLIVAGSGFASITGGSAPITVFGGTGQGVFSGAAGSAFVVGDGASTVSTVAGDAVWLEGSAPVSVAGSNGIDAYGGVSTGNNIFRAGGGSETLWGGAGNDQFLAGTGNDIFVSGGGNDVFSFTSGVAMGIDTVVGFVPGQSTIALHGFGGQVPQMAVSYGDTVINLQNGAQIIVENVTNLTAANFTFV